MAVNDVSVVMAHGGWADGSSWARVLRWYFHSNKNLLRPSQNSELGCVIAVRANES
jgi:hypothetical protein